MTFAVLPFTARLELKANLLAVRGRYEEQLTVAEAMLRPEPDSGEGLALKANALLKLGPPREALPVAEQLLALWDHPYAHALVAAVHYALREDDLAVREAQEATTLMSREELGNPWSGTVLLTLVAAEARRGRKRHWQTLATRSLGSRRSAK